MKMRAYRKLVARVPEVGEMVELTIWVGGRGADGGYCDAFVPITHRELNEGKWYFKGILSEWVVKPVEIEFELKNIGLVERK